MKGGSLSREVVRDDAIEHQVLVNTSATGKESVEDMVHTFEKQLDNKFEGFRETKNPCPATTTAGETPEQVPEVAAELGTLENQDVQFNKRFINVLLESATT